jgi:hypothetical protein
MIGLPLRLRDAIDVNVLCTSQGQEGKGEGKKSRRERERVVKAGSGKFAMCRVFRIGKPWVAIDELAVNIVFGHPA